jgi:hypothetical protein
MYAFSLPVYLLLSLPVIFAIQFLSDLKKVGRVILVCLLPTIISPPFIYEAISDDGNKDGIVKNYFMQYPEWEQAEYTWDVVEYLSKPGKRDYNKVQEYAYRIFEVLPHDAHFWNSVGRADYPLRLYYKDIYNQRTDIKHHSLFNPFMSHEIAKSEAIKMKTALENGEPVYIASLSFPERLVLDQLYLLFDSKKDLKWVSSLPIDRFIDLFPEHTFKQMVLFEDEKIWIYRVVPEDTL